MAAMLKLMVSGSDQVKKACAQGCGGEGDGGGGGVGGSNQNVKQSKTIK